MKKLIFLVMFLFVSCSRIDMGEHTILRKVYKDAFYSNRCLYQTKQGFPTSDKFYAPCDCYEVGDSLNKWFKKENN